MASWAHTPHGRGYTNSLAYFFHQTDYWTYFAEPYQAHGCARQGTGIAAGAGVGAGAGAGAGGSGAGAGVPRAQPGGGDPGKGAPHGTGVHPRGNTTVALVDLWESGTFDRAGAGVGAAGGSTGRPASSRRPHPACAAGEAPFPPPGPDTAHCVYEDELFKQTVLQYIAAHAGAAAGAAAGASTSTPVRTTNRTDRVGMVGAHPATGPTAPMFLFWSPHVAHVAHEATGPDEMLLQVPAKYISRFANISNTYRRLYTSMVGFLDDAVGEVVDALRAHRMWDNTLLVFV